MIAAQMVALVHLYCDGVPARLHRPATCGSTPRPGHGRATPPSSPLRSR